MCLKQWPDKSTTSYMLDFNIIKKNSFGNIGLNIEKLPWICNI